MIFAFAGITLTVLVAPTLFEVITKGWRQTIFVRAAHEISQAPVWRAPTGGGMGIRLGTRPGRDERLGIGRAIFGITFGSVVAEVVCVGVSLAVAVIISAIFMQKQVFVMDFRYLTQVNPVSEFGFWLAPLLGAFIGGKAAGLAVRRATVFCGLMVGLISMVVSIVLYKSSGTPLILHAWLGAIVTLPAWLTLIQFALVVPAGMLGGASARGRAKQSAAE